MYNMTFIIHSIPHESGHQVLSNWDIITLQHLPRNKYCLRHYYSKLR